MKRIGNAVSNMTSNHRGIEAGSAFCWLYKAWAHGNEERGVKALPVDATVVEVGNGGLHSLGYLLDVAPETWTVYAIDPYEGGGRFKDFMQTAIDKLGDVIDRVQFLRTTSPLASVLFALQSVDAVLIDGDHDYGPVYADITSWWPRLKSGGYLAGDDVDPMFEGCEEAWRDWELESGHNVSLYGSTAFARKP